MEPGRASPLSLSFVITIEANLDGIPSSALERFANSARRAAGIRGQVNILIAGNAALRQLNRRFRGKNQPTDVLSFPSSPDVSGRVPIAGDIAISADIAARNAARLGHSLGHEIKILILHGVLHLAGHDHEADNGEMAALEQRLRRRLRLPAVLTERAATRTRRRQTP